MSKGNEDTKEFLEKGKKIIYDTIEQIMEESSKNTKSGQTEHEEPKTPEQTNLNLVRCIEKCGKGPTTEINFDTMKPIKCIDGNESLECSCRFSDCRESCGGGPNMRGDC